MPRRIILWFWPTTWKARLRRAGQIVGAGCLLLLGAALVVVGTAPGREAVLKLALARAERVLPGAVSARPAWPHLGRLELHDVSWTAATDTLARADRLIFVFSLRDLLRRRELHLHELGIDGLRVDAGAASEALAADRQPTDVPAAAKDGTAAIPYLAPGSVFGLPAAAVDRCTVTDAVLRLPDGRLLGLVDATARLELRPRRDTAFDIALRALPLPDLGISWRLQARAGDGLRIATAPLVVTTGSVDALRKPDALPAADRLPLTGSIATSGVVGVWADLPQGLRITDQRVTGALGDYVVSADTRAAGVCSFAVRADWAQPPPYLARLAEAAAGSADGDVAPEKLWPLRLKQLQKQWPRDLPLGCDVTGAVTATDGRYRRLAHAWLRGEFRLPGPAELASLLPAGGHYGDLSGLAAAVSAEATFAPADTTYRLNLDLGATPWLKTGRIALRGNRDALHVERATVAFAGSALDASGTLARHRFDLAFALELPDVAGLARRAGVDPPAVDWIRWTGSCRGPWPLPPAAAGGTLADRLRGVTVRCESATVAAGDATLNAAGRVAGREVDLTLDLDVPDAAALAARVGIVAPAAGRLRAIARLHGPLPMLDGAIDLAIDGRYGDLELPDVTARLAHDRGHIDVRVAAPAGLQTEQVQLDRLALNFTGMLADSLAGADGDLRLAAAGHDLEATIRAGVQAERSGQTSLRVDSLAVSHRGRSLISRAPFGLRIDPDVPALELTDLALRGGVGDFAGGGILAPDELDLTVAVDLDLAAADWEELLPAALPAGADSVAVAGRCQLGGSWAAPTGGVTLSAALSDPDQVGDLVLRLQGWLRNAGHGVSAPTEDGARLPAPEYAPDDGVAVAWQLAQADTLLATGRVALPATVTLQPPAVAAVPRRDLTADLTVAQFDLAKLEPLLPPGTRLAGRLGCDATATGTGEQIELAGILAAQNLVVNLDNGSWLTAAGTAAVTGTAARPLVAGGIAINGGLIRLPEAPPSLLPVAGESLLWEAEALTAASLADGPDRNLPAAAPPARSSLVPTIEMALTCPGNLWLRGRNLDAELSGDLALTLDQGAVRLGGTLSALRGELRILGRTLTIKKGDLIFVPEDPEIDPQLDFQLETQIDKYLYRIAILGRAKTPEMEFSSEPPLSEGDIVSGLLFGRPLSDLDAGEADLVADRSKEIAATYGAALLTQGMARELGVDLITVKAASGTSQASSLVVGKYLSPKVMVQYETPLEDRATSVVRLEYSINRQIKLNSVVSQGEDSGIDLKWLLDY